VEFLVSGMPIGDYVVGVSIAPSYGDERKLLLQIIQELQLRGNGYFIADALYGMSNEILEQLLTLRDILLSRLLGKIKNSYGDKENAKSYDMAVKYVIAKAVLLNYCFLISFLYIYLFKLLLRRLVARSVCTKIRKNQNINSLA